MWLPQEGIKQNELIVRMNNGPQNGHEHIESTTNNVQNLKI